LSSRSTEREEEAGHSCKGICRIFWRSKSRSPDISPLVPAVFLNLQVLYYGLELLVFLKCLLRERQEKLVIDNVVSEKSSY